MGKYEGKEEESDQGQGPNLASTDWKITHSLLSAIALRERGR
jgi:hypothetical protein